MTRARFLVPLCLATLLLTAAAARQGLSRTAPESIGLSKPRLDEATALLTGFVDERKIAGAVAAVARKGRVGYLTAVGVQDLDSRALMTERSLFLIYSMTKPVTAVAAMVLYDAGKFRLEDPVSKYIPEFLNATVATTGGSATPATRPMTIQDLFLHTSGFSHRTSELYRQHNVRSRAEPLPTLIQNMLRVPLMEEPGTRYRYSEATSVLGRLVEIWSGKPFDVYLDEQLFRPLKMVDTGFVVRSDQRARWTEVYAPASGGGLVATETESLPFTERPALLEGAVGLVSTVPDYLRFAQMLLNRGELDGVRILTAATAARITVNGLPEAILAERGGSMGWGLANVNVVLDRASPVRGEYGWDGTAGTIFWVDPARDMITILMTQSAPANPDGIRQKFKALVQRAILD